MAAGPRATPPCREGGASGLRFSTLPLRADSAASSRAAGIRSAATRLQCWGGGRPRLANFNLEDNLRSLAPARATAPRRSLAKEPRRRRLIPRVGHRPAEAEGARALLSRRLHSFGADFLTFPRCARGFWGLVAAASLPSSRISHYWKRSATF